MSPREHMESKTANHSNSTWAEKAWAKVENASSTVAHAVSRASRSAWNTTQGVAHQISDELSSWRAGNASNQSDNEQYLPDAANRHGCHTLRQRELDVSSEWTAVMKAATA
ncbi:unnamed protein product [Effrenium voratum]|nr:unnamed protein product [Effrenium voratum]